MIKLSSAELDERIIMETVLERIGHGGVVDYFQLFRNFPVLIYDVLSKIVLIATV